MSLDHLPGLCKHRHSGRYYVTLSGQEFYLGKQRATARLARDRLIAEWLAAGRRIPNRGDDAEVVTVAIVLAAYKQHAESYYVKNGRPTTELTHIKAASKLLRLHYGNQQAETFGPLSLIALQSIMVDLGWSRSYVNMIRSKIVRIFKWSASRELVPASVYQALATVPGLAKGRTKARETSPVLPVDDETVEATIKHLSPIVADMVMLQRFCGMRPAELCEMRPGDVKQDGDVWEYRPRSHKTEHKGRERVVFIGPKSQAILRPYLADRDPEAYCFAPSESEAIRLTAAHEARTTPLSCGNKPGSNKKQNPKKQKGGRYDVAAYRRAITYACERAFKMPPGLRKAPSKETAEQKQQRLAAARAWRSANVWSPNQLRHSFATEVRRKCGLEAAQVALGHSKADVTQVYAERDHAAAAQAARAVG